MSSQMMELMNKENPLYTHVCKPAHMQLQIMSMAGTREISFLSGITWAFKAELARNVLLYPRINGSAATSTNFRVITIMSKKTLNILIVRVLITVFILFLNYIPKSRLFNIFITTIIL